jgi:hypothetical protein
LGLYGGAPIGDSRAGRRADAFETEGDFMGRSGNGDGDPLWESTGKAGTRRNATDALFAIADALTALGNGNASTHFGALEALGMVVRDGMAAQSSAIAEVATAIGDQQRPRFRAAADEDEDEE